MEHKAKQIFLRGNDGHYFCLLKAFGDISCWDSTGIHQDFDDSDIKSAEFFEGDSFDDFSKERNAWFALNDTVEHLAMGWIDPQGNFYGCGAKFSFHASYPEYAFGKDGEAIFQEGWVYVRRDEWAPYDLNTVVTTAQVETLKKIGCVTDEGAKLLAQGKAFGDFDLEDELDISYKKENWEFKDAFPDGNQAMTDLKSVLGQIIESERAKRVPVRISSVDQLLRYNLSS